MGGKSKGVEDSNSWTWIFQKNKDLKAKPISKPFTKEVEHITSSFYIMNFLDHINTKGLWKVCAPYGRLVDVYIANKRSKLGKRFGFMRFGGVKDPNEFVKFLANLWIGNFHVFFEVARFHRNDKRVGYVQNLKQTTLPNKSTSEHSAMMQTNVVKKSSQKPYFALVVHGKQGTNVLVSSADKVYNIVLSGHDFIKVKDTTKVVLVKVKAFETMSSMYRLCRNEGFSNLKIHHIGGLWAWINFLSVDSCNAFKRNQTLLRLFSLVKTVSPNFCVDERMIWVEISGLPLCA
ncbi:RNA-directed DNA polymerase, eukaryota [Tanacetum coccineum]